MNIKTDDLRQIRQMIDEAFPMGREEHGYSYLHPELVAACVVANAIHEIDNTLSSTAKTALGIR